MRQYIPAESVDLIYLDPPFFSGKNYEVIWKDGAEVRSFEDTKFYTLECECGKVFPENHLYCAFCGAGKDKATERRSNDIEAYLQWLRPKLEECYRVLKPTGSVYVHLDWHAVHYVKVMMDEIFGYNNFKNDITWCYNRWSNVSSSFQRMHDTILFYAKGGTSTFNEIRIPLETPRKRNLVAMVNGKKVSKRDENGKIIYKMQIDKPLSDWWEINPVPKKGGERLGYPTQKPEALLERIIKASSNPGDLVLDPFSGCATCVSVAEKLGRRWIGIDVSPTSCRLMTDRLRKIGYSIGVSDIIDMPQTSDELKDMEAFEFQNWVVQQLGGRQVQKKTGDRGIDGWTFVGNPIQVKQSDKVGSPVVRLFAQDIRDVDKTSVFAKHGISIELVTVGEMLE
jgi:DNA modification methylase